MSGSERAERPISVGIVGLGRAGWGLHVPALEALPERYRVVAACDLEVERLAEAFSRLRCRTYRQFPELLADGDVELVVVATFSHLHANMSIEALQAGKHVIVEKPFATSLQDADRMIAAAGRAGRVLTCHQNSRYRPDFLKVREVLASGRLGRILQVRMAWQSFGRRWDWQTLKRFGGGMLNNNGTHIVDQALLLLGDGEPEVFCHMENTPLYSGDAEDHVKIILQVPGGPLMDVELTSASAYTQDVWQVMGTAGGLTGTHRDLRWKYIDLAALPVRNVDPHPTPDRSYNREELFWTEETWDIASEKHPDGTQQLYAELFETIRQGVPAPITLESLRRQSAVLQKCRDLCPV
jgi:predicted dehydrogenase